MPELFESKPRWPGAPRICLVANLPAFDDPKEIAAFNRTNNGEGGIEQIWRCRHCKCYHFWPKSPAPAGMSSGTGRKNDSGYMQKVIERTAYKFKDFAGQT